MSAVQDFFAGFIGFLTGTDLKPRQQIEVNREGSVEPIQLVYGHQQIQNAHIVFEDTGGSDGKYLYLCAVLCEGPIEAIDEIFLDGRPLSDFPANRTKVFDGATAAGNTNGDDIVVIEKFLGTTTQAQSTVLNESSKWAANPNRRGMGVAYLALRLKGIQKYFTGARPQIAATVRGKLVVDPRNSPAVPVFTANAALCLRDLMTSTIYGRGLSASQLGASWEAAYDDCDTTASVAAEQNLGTPSSILTLAGRTYLVFNTQPAGLFSMEQITLRNGDSSKTATAGIPFNHQGTYGNAGAAYVPFVMTAGADFTTSDTIYAAATGARLLQANIQLNTGSELDTIMSNAQKLLPACRGAMPRVGNQFELYVEKDKAPVYEITTDDIIASKGLDSKLPKKKSKVNRVIAKFRNPSTNWKEDLAVVPAPGSALETTLLEADGGVVLEREVSLPTCVNKYAASDLARVILYRARNDIRLKLECRPRLMERTVGEVVEVTHPSPGWNQKEFLIVDMSISRHGKVTLDLVEYEAAIYTYADIDLDLLSDNTDLPDPFFVPRPTNLVAASVYNVATGGIRQVGINLTWDAIDEDLFDYYEVQYKLTAATDWTSATQVARTNEVDLIPLLWLNTYDLRVRAVSQNFGIVSEWSDVLEHQILLDTTAPDPPTGLSATAGERQVTLSWTNPSDVDFKCVQLFQNTINTIPGTPAQAEVFGSTVTVSNLMDEQIYYFWLRPVDDAGNVGTATASVNATTLPPGTSVAASVVYSATEPASGDFDGQIWQRTSDLALFEWDTASSPAAWIAHTPPDPGAVTLAGVSNPSATEFAGDVVWFNWEFGSNLTIYRHEVEFWWNGEFQFSSKTQDYRGRLAGLSAVAATDLDGTGSPKFPQDGTRDITCRVYTLSSDGITRSANYSELTVTNSQYGALSNVSATVDARTGKVIIDYDRPNDGEFAGVLVYASTSPGFTPGPGNLVRTFYASSNSETVEDQLTASQTWYIRLAAFDVWGKDNLTYSTEVSVTTPSNFGGLAFASSVGTGQINNNAVTRAKVAAGELVNTHVVTAASHTDTAPSFGSTVFDVLTYTFTAEASGLITFAVHMNYFMDNVSSTEVPYVNASIQARINGGTPNELASNFTYFPAAKTTESAFDEYDGAINLIGSTEFKSFPAVSSGDSVEVIVSLQPNSADGSASMASITYQDPHLIVAEYNNT